MLLTPAVIKRGEKDWKYIIIHHSWSPDNKITSDWDSIRKYHMETCHWLDIGYHFGIEYIKEIPVLQIGRSLEMSGAHTIGFNDTGIGICLIGNYDIQIPTVAQMLAIEELCKVLMGLYDISAKHILGHWETYGLRGKEKQKTCPGILFAINSIRERLLQNDFTSEI